MRSLESRITGLEHARNPSTWIVFTDGVAVNQHRQREHQHPEETGEAFRARLRGSVIDWPLPYPKQQGDKQ